ncbi:hypothetical protein TNCV_669531 [Trichonephila clavipes]|nr:hypothetical protein TNCV_669531 [Trichonephila clavipes]
MFKVRLFASLLHISFLGFGWKIVAINSGPKYPKDLLKKRRELPIGANRSEKSNFCGDITMCMMCVEIGNAQAYRQRLQLKRLPRMSKRRRLLLKMTHLPN